MSMRWIPPLVLGIAGLVVWMVGANSGRAAQGPRPYAIVLGVAQDGGRPQAGCAKACCAAAWEDARLRRRAACLAIVDPATGERWLIDATPDFREQLRDLDRVQPPRASPGLSGILLTHAHLGHYAGLGQLGREVLGARDVPVYAMPRMNAFLRTQAPWAQLVTLGNIAVVEIEDGLPVRLGPTLQATPFRVPHRDEYSETVGYRIAGPRRTIVWLPDIDKWDRWETPIEDLIRGCDVAYLDGTFYADGEIAGRDMSEIPHPFIAESLARLGALPAAERAKVRFVHLNHTNPALDPDGSAARAIAAAGFRVAEELERIDL